MTSAEGATAVSATVTRAPSAANARAMQRPMLMAPPVTITDFPSNRPTFSPRAFVVVRQPGSSGPDPAPNVVRSVSGIPRYERGPQPRQAPYLVKSSLTCERRASDAFLGGP